MTKDELFNQLMNRLPLSWDKEDDFRNKALKETLNEYMETISKLDEKPRDWEKINNRIKQLCEAIMRAVKADFNGMHSSAYRTIKNQLDGYESEKIKISKLSSDAYLYKIKKGSTFYRMRNVPIEDRKKLECKDMFHIPFEKRGVVETQRYSVPGYPCLYLGYSVYGCWEEMNRPTFENCMVSRLINQTTFNVLDLRIPTKEKWDSKMKECLLIYPLIIACMIQVKNQHDIYKPEYIIPQLITEWVIIHNKKNKKVSRDIIWGILYTSSQKNDDFKYPTYVFDNLAIPAHKALSNSGHCKDLIELFHICQPTYNELERLKRGPQRSHSKVDNRTEENELKYNYNISDFGELENSLKKYPPQKLDI